MNTKALNRALDLGKKGGNLKSKLLLLIIGVLNQASSWKNTNKLLRKLSALFSQNSRLFIRVRHLGKVVNFSLRIDNNSDYQSLFECFAGMYKIPAENIFYVLDGGSNIGFFSINIFLENQGVKEIVCVEPNPGNLEYLSSNTREIKATVVNAAMANFTGDATFNFKEHNTGHIDGSPGHAYFHDQTVVKCMRIKDVIPPSWNMDNTLVKLDIEGQEYNVFEDMFNSNILPRYVAAELHDYFNAGGAELINSFKSHGYEVLVEGTGDSGNICRQIFAERKIVNA